MKNHIETVKKDQSKIKNAISEINNTLEEINSRLDEAEDTISVLEDKVEKNTQVEQQKEKRHSKNERLRNILDNKEHNNIYIMAISEEEKSEQGKENRFEEVMIENFPNLVKEKHTQVWKAQRVTDKLDPKRPTQGYIIIKITRLKDKEIILKTAREKQGVVYKKAPIRLASDYSTETFQARREWHEIFKVMKSKGIHPRLLYAARLFQIKG